MGFEVSVDDAFSGLENGLGLVSTVGVEGASGYAVTVSKLGGE